MLTMVDRWLLVPMLVCLVGCPADDAIKDGTDCGDEIKCPLGSVPNQSKSATGNCGGGLSANATSQSGSGDAMCFGSGECKFVCMAVEECCGGSKWSNDSYECEVPCKGKSNSNGGGDDPDDGPLTNGGTSGKGGGGQSGNDDSSGGEPAGTDEADAGTEPGPSGDHEPGSNKDSALDLGKLSERKISNEIVGAKDAVDYYRFTLEQNATVVYAVQRVRSGRVTAQLFVDAALIDETKPYAYISASEGMDGQERINLEKGVYYVRVIPASGDSLYDLALTSETYAIAEPAPEPGSDADSATEAGTATSTVAKFGGYVGGTDAEDYYAVTVAENATLVVAGSNVSGRVFIQLFGETPSIDETMPDWQLDTGATAQGEHPVPSGTYYLRVVPWNAANSLYTLEFYIQ